MFSFQALKRSLVYDRVHKERACVAHHLWVGELGATDIDNYLTQLMGRQRCRIDATTLQFGTYVAIVKVGRKVFERR